MLNGFGDIKVYLFCKIAAICHLGFDVAYLGPHMKSTWWSVSLQNLVGIGSVVLVVYCFKCDVNLACKCLFPVIFGRFWE